MSAVDHTAQGYTETKWIGVLLAVVTVAVITSVVWGAW